MLWKNHVRISNYKSARFPKVCHFLTSSNKKPRMGSLIPNSKNNTYIIETDSRSVSSCPYVTDAVEGHLCPLYILVMYLYHQFWHDLISTARVSPQYFYLSYKYFVNISYTCIGTIHCVHLILVLFFFFLDHRLIFRIECKWWQFSLGQFRH